MDENAIADLVIGAAIEVHRALGPGLLESAYQRCLAHEFSLRGIRFQQEVAIDLNYKGLAVETAYRADFIVADHVVLELKAMDRIEPVHRAQVLTYLKWSEKRLGLLLNFNAALLKAGIHRVVNGL